MTPSLINCKNDIVDLHQRNKGAPELGRQKRNKLHKTRWPD